MEWQPIETAPETETDKGGWPVRNRVLLWGRNVGVRTGELCNWKGILSASISNLHGNAVDDWGVTHWMPLPDAPKGPETVPYPKKSLPSAPEPVGRGETG